MTICEFMIPYDQRSIFGNHPCLFTKRRWLSVAALATAAADRLNWHVTLHFHNARTQVMKHTGCWGYQSPRPPFANWTNFTESLLFVWFHGSQSFCNWYSLSNTGWPDCRCGGRGGISMASSGLGRLVWWAEWWPSCPTEVSWASP